FRGAQESRRITAGKGIALENRALRKQRRVQRSQRSPDRAATERAMVPALSENERSTRGRKKASHLFLSQALGKSLRAMAREHSGLVHQPAGLVGTPDTGLVPKIENRKSKIQNRQERLCRR